MRTNTWNAGAQCVTSQVGHIKSQGSSLDRELGIFTWNHFSGKKGLLMRGDKVSVELLFITEDAGLLEVKPVNLAQNVTGADPTKGESVTLLHSREVPADKFCAVWCGCVLFSCAIRRPKN